MMSKNYRLKIFKMELRYGLLTKMVLFTLLFLFPASIEAATYYVDKDGVHGGRCDDSNSGTSWSSPFCTIQRGADKVFLGDTVIVADGIYTATSNDFIRINRSGSSANYITFKSENKWGAKIDGNNRKYSRMFRIYDGVNYVVIEDFEIMNFQKQGVYVANGHKVGYVTIQGNHFHDWGWDDWDQNIGQNGIFLGTDSRYFTIRRNIAHDYGRSTPSDLKTLDHAIYIRRTDSPAGSGCCHTIEYNISYNGTQPYKIGSDDTTVRNNIAVSPWRAAGVVSGPRKNQTWENNIFILDDTSWNKECLWTHWAQTNVVFRNNVCAGAGSNGKMVTSGYGVILKNSNKYGMPVFFDRSKYDFRPKANSNVIEAGYDWGAEFDYAYNSIVGVPDIGAYEYTSQTPKSDATLPSSPFNLRLAIN